MSVWSRIDCPSYNQVISKKGTTSNIWQYFGFPADENGKIVGENIAICKLCQNAVSSKATSNLWRHLKCHHPLQYSNPNSSSQQKRRSSQQKRRLIYQLMKDDAKEISLNSRVTESMSLGTRRINEMPSSTECCPEALQVSDDVLDCKNIEIDQEVFQKMILFFSAFGGKDAHSATRKIMSVCMTFNLARNFNWISSKMKRSFQQYRLIIQLVAASVRQKKSYEDAPVNAIESWIARWLRYATDREGSKKRKLSNLNDENLV